MSRSRAAMLRDEVKDLARAGLDWRSFGERAVGKLAETVGCAAWCVASADPATLLMTGVTADVPIGSPERFFELEYGIEDHLSQRTLARSSVHVDALSRATDGRLDESQRWRELLQPSGLGDWLRGALIANDGCWGYVALMRERQDASFSSGEVDLVARVGSAIADGLRTARHLGDATLAHRDGSGLVVLDRALSLVERTPGTDELLDADVWHAVLAVAARARWSGDAGEHAVVVRTASGWTRLVALPLRADAEPERIAVLAQPARPPETAHLLSSQYGLSAREQEVVRAVVAGNSTAEIADLLHISQLTVQQHLKSVFDKVGVRSRRELVGLVFQHRFLPGFQ